MKINGVASFATSTLSAGSHNIFAQYTGDSNFNGSTVAQFVFVNRANVL